MAIVWFRSTYVYPLFLPGRDVFLKEHLVEEFCKVRDDYIPVRWVELEAEPVYARCPVTGPCSQGTENIVGDDWSFQLCSLSVWAHRWYAIEQSVITFSSTVMGSNIHARCWTKVFLMSFGVVYVVLSASCTTLICRISRQRRCFRTRKRVGSSSSILSCACVSRRNFARLLQLRLTIFALYGWKT